jgi:diguanylate cyclase (GGDEF)-like protein
LDLRQVLEIVIIALAAVTYFYFNWRYFYFVKAQKQMKSLRVRYVLLCFVLNYIIFVVCSILELHLVANWSIFAAALLLETLLYTGRDRRCSLFSTLTGIICGLAINILCRAVISILTGLPLQNFDNHTRYLGNLKGIPVPLGFLFTGIILRIFTRPAYIHRLRLILRYPKHQKFLLEMMAGLFFYLFLNLILYSAPYNDLLLKGWSIKSCLFAIIGYHIAIWYTWRICLLTDYQHKNKAIEHELAAWQQIVPQLYQDAVHDGLTGLFNRQHALEVLASLFNQGIPFLLCFVDLDCLKQMNDVYGHTEGDRYLRTVSDQLRHMFRRNQDMLFRYGGDEFLCLIRGLPMDEVERRLADVNERLARLEDEGFLLPISISYGVADSRLFSGAAQLIAEADQKMYEQKQRKRNDRKRGLWKGIRE